MKILPDYIKYNAGLIGLIIFIIGLFFSKALLSISLGFIFAQPFLVYSVKEVFKKIFSNRLNILFILFYLSILLSGINTENKREFLEDAILKLPLLVIPFGLLYKPLYLRQNYLVFFYILNSIVCLVGLATLVNYIINYTEIIEQIKHSKPIPVFPADKLGHIYFGFIQAFAIISGFFIYIRKMTSVIWRNFQLVITVISFILLHIIGSRTGLVTFYAGSAVLLIAWGFIEKRYVLTMILFILFVLTGLLSIIYIPSLNKKYQSTVKDISQYVHHRDLNYYSISMRIMAWDKTVEIIRDHPLFGVGYGDVLDEIKTRYREEGTSLLEENQKEPHNQFLEVFAATGIFGFLLFMCLFLYPLIRVFKNRDLELLSLVVIMFVTFNIESALEMQAGVCYFTLMWVYLVNLPPEFDPDLKEKIRFQILKQ